MIRRDFFKAIAACGAALAAGRTAIASIEPPTVDLKPKQFVSFARTLSDPQKTAISLLNKCVVASFKSTKIGNARLWEVEYTYDQHGRYFVNLNEELAKHMPAVAEPLTIRVVTEYDSIPVAHLGWTENLRIEEPRHRIIVEWVTP